jgi:enamine deaminase RidA (YjgF/YER057c/UK114 family)
MNENREVLHGGDFRRQCEYVFGQLVSRLAQGGAKVSDLVKITVFLSDFRYFPILAEVRKGILPSPGPTSSAIQVAGLAHPDLLIEVEGFAVTESPKS